MAKAHKRYANVFSEPLQLLVDPALRFVSLAMRAVPVAAGMRHPAFLFAAVAGQLHPGRGGAAAQDEMQCNLRV